MKDVIKGGLICAVLLACGPPGWIVLCIYVVYLLIFGFIV